MIGSDVRVSVIVNGTDYSDRFSPRFHSLSISKSRKAESDTADIVVDDTDGQLRLPPEKSAIEIRIGRKGQPMTRRFRGLTDMPKAGIDRSGGRVISIHAKATDMNGEGKVRRQKDFIDTTLGDALSEAAGLAGMSIAVHPSLASLPIAFEAMDGESFYAFGKRMAAELGATFKAELDRAAFVPRNAGQTVKGSPIPMVTIAAGNNLHGANLTPLIGRALFKRHKAKWFDRETAGWLIEETEAKGDLAARAQASDKVATATRATKAQAKAEADASATNAESEAGKGTIDCEGDGRLMPEGYVRLEGHRPGCDGTYVIDSMTEQVDRSSSWTASLSVERPGGGAGEDKR